MPHFFVPPENIMEDRVLIKGPEARHLSTVLRQKEGDEIKVFDGLGNCFLVKITRVGRTKEPPIVEGVIIGRITEGSEPTLTITLYQSILKGRKIEFIIQKCTELGVQRIVPMRTERSIVKLDPERCQQRVSRWKKIALEAVKQCRGSLAPQIGSIVGFSDALEQFEVQDFHLGIIGWEREKSNTLREVLKASWSGQRKDFRLAIFIGPEGGFTQQEVQRAREKRVVPVGLGPRILRSETAGFLIPALALYEWGDLS